MSIPLSIRRHTLDNGLVVALLPRRHTPVVAVDVWYRVGSKNETPGRSGFAHLFEHMMFQGSANVARSEHMRLISDVGGTMNGSTNKDRTNFYNVVPTNQLELALWLEADRMRSLELTRENFASQLAAVKEERRQRVDNAPYARVLYEILDDIFYQKWGYAHSLIGSLADLEEARFEEVADFHRRHYRPNNAVLAVVGDIDTDAALALVERHFGDIPAGDSPSAVDLDEPKRAAEQRHRYPDRFARLPAWVAAYQAPPYGHPDYYPLEMLDKILFDGESARLYHRLLESDHLLLHMVGGIDARMGPGMFSVFGQLAPGVPFAAVEAAFDEEIARLHAGGVTERELEKARNQLRADRVAKMEQVLHLAELLCLYITYFDDPFLVNSELDRYLAVRLDDVDRAIRDYLVPERRTLMEIEPETAVTQPVAD